MAEKKFPGCVGFITETTITLSWDPSFSRRVHSHKVQVVCDMDGFIIKIFLGSSGNSGVRNLRSSSLWKHPDRYFSKGEYLLADATYPLSTICVPTFKGNDLTMDQTRFNSRLDRVRKVKGCIAMMKVKWPSLTESPAIPAEKTMGRDMMLKVLRWISAIAILHNFMRQRKETPATTRVVRAPATLDHATGEELREYLLQAARRPGRKPGGIVKRKGSARDSAVNGAGEPR